MDTKGLYLFESMIVRSIAWHVLLSCSVPRDINGISAAQTASYRVHRSLSSTRIELAVIISVNRKEQNIRVVPERVLRTVALLKQRIKPSG